MTTQGVYHEMEIMGGRGESKGVSWRVYHCARIMGASEEEERGRKCEASG